MAKHKQLYMVGEEPGEGEWLAMAKYADDYPIRRKISAVEVKAEDVAEMLDQSAENSNHHAFVGTHAALLKILNEVVTKGVSKEIMLAICDKGGLHEIDR